MELLKKEKELSKEVKMRWSYCREKKCEFFKKSGYGCKVNLHPYDCECNDTEY